MSDLFFGNFVFGMDEIVPYEEYKGPTDLLGEVIQLMSNFIAGGGQILLGFDRYNKSSHKNQNYPLYKSFLSTHMYLELNKGIYTRASNNTFQFEKLGKIREVVNIYNQDALKAMKYIDLEDYSTSLALKDIRAVLLKALIG